MANAATPLLRNATSRMPSLLWKSGAALVFVGMAAGSFGAHGLKARTDIPAQRKESFETGCRYAVYNGLGLMLVSMHPRFAVHRFAGPAILAGSLVFSGSIFGLVLGPDALRPVLGPITPIGGTVLMAGYLAMLF